MAEHGPRRSTSVPSLIWGLLAAILVIAMPEPAVDASSWIDTVFLAIVAAVLSRANIRLKYGIINMSGAAISAAVASLSPLQAAVVGLAGQADRAWSRRRQERVPSNLGSGLWGAFGATVRYLCLAHGLPIQIAVAVALLAGVAVNILYTSVSLSFLTSVPALHMVRQIFTPAVIGAYGYFLIAGALASTMLGHSYDGLWRASGLFVLAIAIGDNVGGRSIRAFLERQLVDTEPHVQYGRLAQSTLHDLRNNVGAAIANLLEVRTDRIDLEDAQAIASAMMSLQDARQILKNTEATRRSSALTAFSQVDLAELCRNVTIVDRRLASAHGVALSVDTPDTEVPVFANAVLLSEVLTNLIINAVDACHPSGSVVVRCRVQGSRCLAMVIDTGKGVPEDLVDRIFDPGFSTKGSHGSGLGLYTALGVARQHRGDLTYSPVPGGQGSCFTLALPDFATGQQGLVSSPVKGAFAQATQHRPA